MTITADNWVDWAVRLDGIPDKVWRPRRHKAYFVNHSIEGYLHGEPVPPRFLSTARNPDGSYTSTAQASVHFVLHVDGTLIQMYPLQASPWTSGSQEANEAGVAIESEGVAGTPLNEAQCATYVRLIRELEPWFGFELSRAAGTIKEHRELAQTACPSGRYDTAYAALEDDMADPRVDAIIAALGGQAEIDKWNGPSDAPTGNSLLVGYALEQQKLADHLENHTLAAQLPAGVVPDHEHEPGGVKR